MSWHAQQYSIFEAQRTRPVRDLIAAIPTAAVHHAIDLGCGPGNSTEILAQRFPHARISGLDSAADMLHAARERLPQLSFQAGDIGQWQAAQPLEVILANASLQWLPDHDQLYPRLVAQLAAGGTLAVQTPDNLQEPAHRLLRKVAGNGPWAARFAGFSLPPRHDAAFYYRLLRPLCQQVDVWRTTYHHPLAGGIGAVVEWFKGSALGPYLSQLDEPQAEAFLAQYHAELASAYEVLPDGSVLLPFPRLFVIAQR
ncbi:MULTISPECIES: trans-aconitate 2-methyltransferase [unclassified Pseudomonas]|uniref:trans-aconitate 2-methyltransferase n=1 Tax=unclassified Pseudomonas TaxID=196821 RepID=UPI000BD33DB1|nr:MULTISPECIES: trans-aconitate 2-methyltransferase [unclassified Pseudomonas]PVZ16232.1 trans-aconitate 2-methyltransferase [Pseudomonas sp. URIL14HWK12:I12]PVZ25912.1 trans-aconitate 2-methyltransferase [Pseudomonas sp. URIL14HWK12:I10]PVZ36564.1 trans-aconitate 2-methyltransferase [Pseudomonas sp. URIL14HWK12:I11]SNZ13155.1 trans-aconitate 2-methyltransferase [Pseudomonas sp. URIL14HWK12:I9]